MRVVLASNNAGKIKEFRALLKDFPIELIPQNEIGVDEVEETGLSFIENAIIKARHAAKISGHPALADDSGLVVPALAGAPGIYSARYAGPTATMAENIAKLLTELKQVPENERVAYFHCVLVWMSHSRDPAPLVCEGRWAGAILTEQRGTQGFGYDSVFYLAALDKTAAELSSEMKNSMSHRSKAWQALLNRAPFKNDSE